MKQDIRRIITEFLREGYQEPFTTKELVRRLNLRKQGDSYLRLKNALEEMQAERILERVHGGKWKPAREENTVEGIFHRGRRGGGIVRSEDFSDREIAISAAGMNGATEGALVRVAVSMVDETLNGRVVEILEAKDQFVTGTLKKYRQFWFVEPDGKDFRRDIRISHRGGNAEDGDKVVVRIAPEDFDDRNPEGEIVDVLGISGKADVEIRAVAQRFGLTAEFPRAVDAEAELIPVQIPAKEIARRRDFRKSICFTIDPADAKDFDDAVSLERDAEGRYILGVHIADVSRFVKESSLIDAEAKARGTSAYLIHQVYPMLPERLSNHLCSLKEGKERLTFSVFMTMTPRGAVKDYSIEETVIRSAKRFSYEEVQEILDSKEGEYADILLEMEKLANVLMKKRFRSGAIDFNLPEMAFVTDAAGHPLDVKPKERLMSMRLIEEFMLLANKTVTEAVKGMSPRGQILPFIYRVHDTPDPEKVKDLVEFLKYSGIRFTLDPNSPKSFQEMLASIEGSEFSSVIQDITLRTMAKAVYSQKNIGHFGLAFPEYTHFTSPIRRYPDLVVHRLLKQYIARTSGESSSKVSELALKDIASHSSIRERVAMEAEREAVKVMEIIFLQRHIGEEFTGVISTVKEYGVYVELLPTLIEGFVHVRSMDSDFYEYNPKTKSLVGKRRNNRYKYGDRIKVVVSAVNLPLRTVDLLIV
jgi:ribonuclease R